MSDQPSLSLADSHVHLHAYAEVAGLLERAARAGVDRIVAVSVDVPTAQQTVALAHQYQVATGTATRPGSPRLPEVIAAVGWHPVHLPAGEAEAALAPAVQDALAALAPLAQDPRVGFIGEIGVDTIDGRAPLEQQLSVFRAQLDLARRSGKPVNLHLRGAGSVALAMLAADGVPPAGAVLHYFVGDAAQARRALALGLYLSVGKPVTRVDNGALRAAVPQIPLDRLLLETDSYPLPGRTTEPKDVHLVAEAIADLRGMPVAAVAAATNQNLARLLGKIAS
jgi:TatD DNase family protein